TNAELGVFADGECRAAAMTNEKGVAYLTIPGDDAAVLTFKVAMGDKEAEAAESVTYEVDAVYGSPKHPFVIDLSGATEIEIVESGDERVEIYDLQGRKVTSEKARLNKGVYIVNGRKQVVK
ncbi:MAG: T9SS type A sorting domain-containing protein, partial [Bacteroidaceae bacterium]|nr:T9SS type A sorting domain-containing protein [Bacteroidaceae bacterium]